MRNSIKLAAMMALAATAMVEQSNDFGLTPSAKKTILTKKQKKARAASKRAKKARKQKR